MTQSQSGVEAPIISPSGKVPTYDPYYEYRHMERIGEGTYGIVYRAIDRDNKPVAMKWIPLTNNIQTGVPSTALREIALLTRLNHTNVISLQKVFHKRDLPDHFDPHNVPRGKNVTYLILVMHLMDWDLMSILANTQQFTNRGPKYNPSIPTLDRTRVSSYMFQILAGLAYLHSVRILHRDLKPQNILINTDGIAVLADFGLGRCHGIPVTHTHSYYTKARDDKYSRIGGYTPDVVTLWYRSPDILLGNNHYGTDVDIWSVGCIFAELLRGDPLFPGRDRLDQLSLITDLMGPPPQSYWDWIEEHRGQGLSTYEGWMDVYKEHCRKMGSPPNDQIDWDHNPEMAMATLNGRLAGIPEIGSDPHAVDLLCRMFDFNVHNRISAKEALRHPYFKGVLLPPTMLVMKND